MPRSATIMAAKVSELSRKQVAIPTVAISTPATAGPKMRAAWIRALFRPTAFTTRSDPTISVTKLWRVGLSTAFTAPRANTRPKTIQASTRPPAVRPQRSSAGMAMSAWVTRSSRRFERRSASSPPQTAKSSIGRNWRAAVRPTAPALSVSVRISHISATICIQLPLSETSCPAKYRR